MLFFGLHYTIHDFKMPKSIPKFRKKKVAEKRQNVKVAISQKLEPIEKNQGDFRIQHNKMVLNWLTKPSHQKKNVFFLLPCLIKQNIKFLWFKFIIEITDKHSAGNSWKSMWINQNQSTNAIAKEKLSPITNTRCIGWIKRKINQGEGRGNWITARLRAAVVDVGFSVTQHSRRMLLEGVHSSLETLASLLLLLFPSDLLHREHTSSLFGQLRSRLWIHPTLHRYKYIYLECTYRVFKPLYHFASLRISLNVNNTFYSFFWGWSEPDLTYSFFFFSFLFLKIT